jgi:hypothetical protein
MAPDEPKVGAFRRDTAVFDTDRHVAVAARLSCCSVLYGLNGAITQQWEELSVYRVVLSPSGTMRWHEEHAVRQLEPQRRMQLVAQARQGTAPVLQGTTALVVLTPTHASFVCAGPPKSENFAFSVLTRRERVNSR